MDPLEVRAIQTEILAAPNVVWQEVGEVHPVIECDARYACRAAVSAFVGSAAQSHIDRWISGKRIDFVKCNMRKSANAVLPLLHASLAAS